MNGSNPPFYMPQPQPAGFDYLTSIQQFNTPQIQVPYSPVSANGMPAAAPTGAAPPTWQNPYKWQSWNASSGLGDFLGANAPLLFGGLNALSGGLQAWTGLQGLNLAKDAFKQEKRAYNINLSNQTKAYNTQISDRIAGRSYASEAERQAALAAATLTDRSKYGNGG